MRRALALAATAAGDVFPNPLVGCVLIDADGDVVGEGYHPKAGEPHAEVFARARRASARAAPRVRQPRTVDHYGRTPPCSRALVDAGVAKVVVGFVDPDPRVSGGGTDERSSTPAEVSWGAKSRRAGRSTGSS